MNNYSKYVGLDVHKETIVAAIAKAGRGDAMQYGEIDSTAEAIQKLAKKMSANGERVLFCYEAGPCGYGIYWQLKEMGQECMVVAPSLIPKKAGDRIKTDSRDAVTLARLSRAGELTAVWVPDKEQEAVRDLTRAREDMKVMEHHARQQLGAFLLRHGKRYPGKSAWTQAHFRWMEDLRFEHPCQQIVFQEYVDMVKHAQGRLEALEQQMLAVLETWSMREVAIALMALRGVKLIAAMTILAELGDLSRFESAPQLMAYLGLVPSEHSTGQKKKRGGITKSGNGHVRRVLVEAGWSYRFPARKTAALQRYAEKASDEVQEIAWKAQKRLCMRYRHLLLKGKLKVEVCTAVARELTGFIWAIACEVMKKRGIKTITKAKAA
jgi:transposase